MNSPQNDISFITRLDVYGPCLHVAMTSGTARELEQPLGIFKALTRGIAWGATRSLPWQMHRLIASYDHSDVVTAIQHELFLADHEKHWLMYKTTGRVALAPWVLSHEFHERLDRWWRNEFGRSKDSEAIDDEHTVEISSDSIWQREPEIAAKAEEVLGRFDQTTRAIVGLMVKGYQNREIAEALTMSYEHVKYKKKRFFAKVREMNLNRNSRGEL